MLKKEYDFNMLSGSISAFNQELMLRIMSKEDRLIRDSEILWYSRDNLLENKDRFNFYITTDFATSEKSTADFRVISVWAYNNAGHWFWVDGICNKDSIHKFWEDLFRLNQLYNPQQVALEVSGQQQGLVKWVESEMMKRNNWMNLASENNSGSAGIRPKGNKFQRFYDFAPRFAQHTVHFPTELKEGDVMSEFMTELTLVSQTSFRSKHDDCLDTISMLASLTPWKPTEEGRISPKGVFSEWEEETHDSHISSYIV
ncbi:MAG: hypothetical protein DRP64_20180 [Verrucomicrobia bacterium]|nr:MAG: hypothetical protein DRP64_20180 [Verrucomicrobiota bacterium]